MLKYLQVDFEIPLMNKSIYGIQLHILKKLKVFKYINYSRINIEPILSNHKRIMVYGIDDKICTIMIGHNKSSSTDSISEIYNLIKKALLELWRMNAWKEKHIVAVFDEIAKENYKYDVSYFKELISNDLNYSAALKLSIDKDLAYFYLQIYHNKKLTSSISILNTIANQFLFSRFFHKAYWDDENRYVIEDRDGEIFIKSDIYNNSIEVIFVGKNHKEEQLKYFYEILKYEEGKDNSTKLFELPL